MKRSSLFVYLILIFPLFLLTFSSRVFAQNAKADLLDAQGKSVGIADFRQTPEGVQMVLSVSGLSAGPHGIHIHAIGQCTPPDFKSAGGHFNPEGKKHGIQNSEGAHAGDLPNLKIGEDGTAEIDTILHQVSLEEGKDSLLQPEGTALVIHAAQDDEKTDPSGNSGDRIACGVITRA